MTTATGPLDETAGWRAGTWQLDPERSTIGFEVRLLGVSTARGRFRRWTATVTTGERLVDTRARAVIEVGSIDTGLPERDQEHRTRTYFDADAHPLMTFASTGAHVDDGLRLTGDLTLRGATRPVGVDVSAIGLAADERGRVLLYFEASARIDRTEFGVGAETVTAAGDLALGRVVTILIDAVLVATA